ncbi:uncharacterized protein LOC120137907 [Hibiscus syriacus]|uniref:uncharacterized protein LOC120137907 n=1 Tax=Hibiscus syriacus TaxID=106335 RepID=UPI0019216C57|nr:uncharacterized protein LOC120137907 [Hibiscus syriacus]
MKFAIIVGLVFLKRIVVSYGKDAFLFFWSCYRTSTKYIIFALRGCMLLHCLKERWLVSHLISFCQSAYSRLKEDIENVVVVHCKAEMVRTGLMISNLLYLKFFPTAEENGLLQLEKTCGSEGACFAKSN